MISQISHVPKSGLALILFASNPLYELFKVQAFPGIEPLGLLDLYSSSQILLAHSGCQQEMDIF